MKLAHIAIRSPNLCGLYETTRELVVNLRELSYSCDKPEFDARLVDPKPVPGLKLPANEDRGAPYADMEWAKTADVIVNHSGFDGTPLEATHQPVIHISHGRPLSSHISHRKGNGAPIAAYQFQRSKDPRFKAVVTFWPEHVPYLKFAWHPVPVYCIGSFVDLDAWTPNGPKGYSFHGKTGSPNVVITDPWREDVDPFLTINAFGVFCKSFKSAKLHIYGAPKDLKGFDPFFARLESTGNLGEVKGWVSGLDNVYRAADLMITPHKIYTRSIREAMACGCQVVSGRDIDPENIEAFAVKMGERLIKPEYTRKNAEIWFDPRIAAQEFADIVERVV